MLASERMRHVVCSVLEVCSVGVCLCVHVQVMPPYLHHAHACVYSCLPPVVRTCLWGVSAAVRPSAAKGLQHTTRFAWLRSVGRILVATRRSGVVQGLQQVIHIIVQQQQQQAKTTMPTSTGRPRP